MHGKKIIAWKRKEEERKEISAKMKKGD